MDQFLTSKKYTFTIYCIIWLLGILATHKILFISVACFCSLVVIIIFWVLKSLFFVINNYILTFILKCFKNCKAKLNSTIFVFKILEYFIIYFLIFNIIIIISLIPHLVFIKFLIFAYLLILIFSLYNIFAENEKFLCKYFSKYLHIVFILTNLYPKFYLQIAIAVLLISTLHIIFLLRSNKYKIIKLFITDKEYYLAINLLDRYIDENKTDLKLFYLKYVCYFYLDNYNKAAEILSYVKNNAYKQDKNLYEQCCKEIELWNEV